MANELKHAADLCLYGARKYGAGWLATAADGRLLGDGELKFHSMTTAIYDASDALLKAGIEGMMRIFDSGGKRMAWAKISSPGWYGALTWEPAPIIEISMEDFLAAAEKAN